MARDDKDEGGLEVVLGALREEDFPMDKEDLYYAVGDLAVTDGVGRIVAVREVLDRLRKARFQSVEDVAQSLRETMIADEASTPPDVR
jgi:hypothetical protein